LRKNQLEDLDHSLMAHAVAAALVHWASVAVVSVSLVARAWLAHIVATVITQIYFFHGSAHCHFSLEVQDQVPVAVICCREMLNKEVVADF
jgi:hypothetical protein